MFLKFLLLFLLAHINQKRHKTSKSLKGIHDVETEKEYENLGRIVFSGVVPFQVVPGTRSMSSARWRWSLAGGKSYVSSRRVCRTSEADRSRRPFTCYTHRPCRCGCWRHPGPQLVIITPDQVTWPRRWYDFQTNDVISASSTRTPVCMCPCICACPSVMMGDYASDDIHDGVFSVRRWLATTNVSHDSSCISISSTSRCSYRYEQKYDKLRYDARKIEILSKLFLLSLLLDTLTSLSLVIDNLTWHYIDIKSALVVAFLRERDRK